MNRQFRLFSLAIVLLIMLGAGMGASAQSVELELVLNSPDPVTAAYREVVREFEALNPNIKINVSSQGRDFESLMRTRMASMDLPDMWTTHGWSVERYSEYLRPLNDQPWIDSIIDSLLPTVSNDAGEIFVLPVDADQAGVVVNKTVVQNAGVDPYELHTWDDFLAAFQAIKDNGDIPVGMYGRDPRSFARFMLFAGTSLLTASPSNDHREALMDGTFDWTEYDKVNQLLVDLREAGYVNVDVLTASADTVHQSMALDELAFIFTNNAAVVSVLEYNPDANVGFVPVFASYDDAERVLIGGERNAIGVAKDTPNTEEALLFLEFLAQPENIILVSEAQGLPPALEGIENDLGVLTEDYQRWQSVPIEPYFDRFYLPSGMWSVLQSVGAGVMSGEYTVREGSQVMEENYLRLRDAAE